MRWIEISIHTTEEAQEAISNFFHELGAGGVSIEESGTLNKKRDTSLGQWYEFPLNDIPEGEAVIKAYFAEGTDVGATVSQLRESVAELPKFGLQVGKALIEVKEVKEEDWANNWKAYFKPLRITDKLTIKPTWEAYEPSEQELIIELDPGMAFGTGTHATTALCLRALEQILRGGEDVIDVGTGSGVLAIAAAKLGAKHVLAIDLDPVAIDSATENTRLNGLGNRITIKKSDLLQLLHRKDANENLQGKLHATSSPDNLGLKLPVQVIVANILAEILLLFVDDVYQTLAKGGYYIASGIIKSKAALVEQALIQAGFAVESKKEEQDWVALVARKM